MCYPASLKKKKKSDELHVLHPSLPVDVVAVAEEKKILNQLKNEEWPHELAYELAELSFLCWFSGQYTQNNASNHTIEHPQQMCNCINWNAPHSFLHIIHITSKTQHAEGYSSAESGYDS